MDWTFRNAKRLMSFGVFLFWFGLTGVVIDVFLFRDLSGWFVDAGLSGAGIVVLVTVYRAGPPADFHDHVDSEGREY